MKTNLTFFTVILFTIVLLTANIITIIIDVDMLKNKVETLEHIQMLSEKWFDSIHNPINQPFVLEIATKLEIHQDSVTQEQFEQRYLRFE